MSIVKVSLEEKARVNAGFQCPECSSVKVVGRFDNMRQISSNSFECRDCGCWWDRSCYPRSVR